MTHRLTLIDHSIFQYFHSKVVSTVFLTKYDDGQLDYNHDMVGLLKQISRLPAWNAVIGKRVRAKIFKEPVMRHAHHGDERQRAFDVSDLLLLFREGCFHLPP